MRIGAKLLVTYLIIIGLIGGLAVVTLPRLVENSVRQYEQTRLAESVRRQSASISRRLNAGTRNAPLRDIAAARSALKGVQETLVDEYLVFVDQNCEIVAGSRPELNGRRLPGCEAAPQRRPLFRQSAQPAGSDFLVAMAPLQTDQPLLKGYSLAMIRDVQDVQALAKPIARLLVAVLLTGVLASLVVAGWLSREMVKRLRATGAAARALAEGDLASRAPEAGNDEITDLARHFNHMAERFQTLVNGLRRSEQARKELLVTCSHELRTPMTSISGFAEALRDGVVQGEEKRQRYYQIIAGESARLTRLINDLFDMAKLDAGQIELRLQAMPVAPWLTEFAEQFRDLAAEHQVGLAAAIDDSARGTRIYGDRDRLDQVLMNLAGNAVRFSPPGETVTLRARQDGDDVLVEVADRGPGIPTDESGRIFERFYQGKSNGNGHKGAGLGLAIVKSLVEAHGGTVGVHSAPGLGSVFWIRIKRLGE